MPKRETKASKDRAYHVLCYGLSEENRVCKLSPDELRQRMEEIWKICYGKNKVETRE